MDPYINGYHNYDAPERALEIANHELYNNIIERLTNLALSQFEWHGLPDTLDRYYMERTLLLHGRCVIFRPPGGDMWLVSHFVHNGGNFDIYGRPQLDGIRAIDAMGRELPIDPDTAYILYDNTALDRRPLMSAIALHARKLYEIEQSIRMNLRHQNKPYIIATGGDKERSSVIQLMRKMFNYDPVISVKSRKGGEDLADRVKTVDTKVTLIVGDLQQAWVHEWKRALNVLGISAETTKRERMLSGELVMNRQEDTISLQARMLNRVEFCNMFNEDHPDYELSVNLSDTPEPETPEPTTPAPYDTERENL